MIQNLLLFTMALMCVLLLISLINKPFDNNIRNSCTFKLLPPKYTINGKNKIATFNIVVEKKHRYFINFPLLFKFYSNEKFKTLVRIKYLTLDEEQILLEKKIEFTSNIYEQVVYITDVIVGKITIVVLLDIEYGNPIVSFEIMKNNTCDITKEYKVELFS